MSGRIWRGPFTRPEETVIPKDTSLAKRLGCPQLFEHCAKAIVVKAWLPYELEMPGQLPFGKRCGRAPMHSKPPLQCDHVMLRSETGTFSCRGKERAMKEIKM
jgi:hypothetical protein